MVQVPAKVRRTGRRAVAVSTGSFSLRARGDLRIDSAGAAWWLGTGAGGLLACAIIATGDAVAAWLTVVEEIKGKAYR